MPLRLSIFLLLSFCISIPDFAFAKYYFGVSVFSPSFMGRTSSDSAKKEVLAPFQFPLSFAYPYEIGYSGRILPQISYTLLPKKSPEGGSEETHLLLQLPYLGRFGDNFGEGLEWKAGIVLHQMKIVGKGGTTVLNNGNSSKTFYLPDSTKTVNTVEAELGLAYPFGRVLTEGSLLVEAPFSTSRRSYALFFSFMYTFGERF